MIKADEAIKAVLTHKPACAYDCSRSHQIKTAKVETELVQWFCDVLRKCNIEHLNTYINKSAHIYMHIYIHIQTHRNIHIDIYKQKNNKSETFIHVFNLFHISTHGHSYNFNPRKWLPISSSNTARNQLIL